MENGVMDMEPSLHSDFPMRDIVEDYAGRERVFEINCHENALGWTVRAVEEGRDGGGYEFAAYSETSPYSALGRVRDKMRRGLATRYIRESQFGYELTHDQIRGRIESDLEGGISLIVDGLPLSIDDLAQILSAYEGWTLSLRVEDGLE
jgi:hypothetical protein